MVRARGRRGAARAALLVPLLAAACGGSGSGSNNASAPGITATTVSIGSTQPLTGPAALGYSEIAPASNAYFAYVNAHGGVFGRTIKYTYLDDGYVVSNTPTQTRKLVLQDNVFAIFGALGTPTHLSVVDYLNSEKIPDVFVSSGCNCWNNPSKYPYTFGWQPDYTIEGKILGQYIKQTYAGMKVGYFAQGPNDEFGDDGIAGLNDELQGSNVTVVSPPQYYAPTAAGAMAVKNNIAALQSAGVQVIAGFSVPLFTAVAEASAAALNYHPIFVVSTVGSDPPTLSK
ncbi:MAG: ABC transporter substrate-binding protein, partial [Candidatus Dormibacteraeota bacterium]|nr:ABC transporter substrate-binding protein [Candidatus Dormibacteraeota bacterium]